MDNAFTITVAIFGAGFLMWKVPKLAALAVGGVAFYVVWCIVGGIVNHPAPFG